ncbi:GEM-like protein 1 [Syzygium oleosum]|uniref:GEM-like protein 1 n=1 Tax=Syzygium oleosum TaxID=219896 RepID=UPI0024BBB429|nr:GEM-like protein 1 [Syzygium oleosum]
MGCRSESASTHCGTCVVAGMPVEPRELLASQHATTWVANEVHPTSFHSSYLHANASGSVSGFVNLNKSSNENMYLDVAPMNGSAPSGSDPINKVCDKLNRCGKRVDDATRKAEALVDNVWHHLKSSHSITDAAIARLAQGTKMLIEGGRDKVFEHTFEILPGEKLLKTYACYLSTSSGLVIGTLYLSTKRLLFHGDEPLCHYAPSGQQEWVCYKVVLLLDQLSFVSPSPKGLDHSEKYIQVVSRDGYEFRFMGFVSYDKALKNINEALQHNRENNMAGRIQVRSVARWGT